MHRDVSSRNATDRGNIPLAYPGPSMCAPCLAGVGLGGQKRRAAKKARILKEPSAEM